MRAMSLIAIFGSIAVPAASASVLRVPSDYPTIQKAIDAAVSGDSVLVAPGIYTNCDEGPCASNVALLKGGVALVSEGGPAATLLQVDTPAGGASVVRGAGIVTGGVLLSGFTIRASAPGYRGVSFISCQDVRVEECNFEDLGGGVQDGAGLFANGSTIQVRDCEFRRCAALLEAGGFRGVNGSSVLERCIFEECVRGGASLEGLGSSMAIVRDCTFRKNTENAALIVLEMPEAEIVNNLFVENTSENNAATLSVVASSGDAIAHENLFVNNTGLTQTPVVLWSAPGEFGGNTLYGNASPRAVFSHPAMPLTATNNIFAGSTGSPAFRAGTVPPQASCNLFWKNSGGDYLGYIPSSTDLFVDPRFCDPKESDFRLMADSPCLPENSGTCGLIGALGEGCGTVSVSPSSWARIKSAYR